MCEQNGSPIKPYHRIIMVLSYMIAAGLSFVLFSLVENLKTIVFFSTHSRSFLIVQVSRLIYSLSLISTNFVILSNVIVEYYQNIQGWLGHLYLIPLDFPVGWIFCNGQFWVKIQSQNRLTSHSV